MLIFNTTAQPHSTPSVILVGFSIITIFFFFEFSPYRTAGLASFPDYLVLRMRKFVMEKGWVPKKAWYLSCALFASLQSKFFNIITFVLLEMCNY